MSLGHSQERERRKICGSLPYHTSVPGQVSVFRNGKESGKYEVLKMSSAYSMIMY